MTLYEINEKLRDFDFEIDEETGEILNTDELDNLELSKSEKIENICLLIKNLKADAVAYKNEKDSFSDKERVTKNRIKSLTGYLESALDGETFKSTKASITYRKSEVIEVVDGAEIPKEYLRFKEPEIDKVELKKAVKSGINIAGVQIVEKQNMQIK